MILLKDPFVSKSAEETQELAKSLAEKVASLPLKKEAYILAFSGDLGAGKTNFVQGFATGFRVTNKVLSPTFVIMKKFPISSGGFETLVHIDCYRVDKEEDLLELGWSDSFKDPKSVI